jgi:hypothetical protein
MIVDDCNLSCNRLVVGLFVFEGINNNILSFTFKVKRSHTEITQNHSINYYLDEKTHIYKIME